jgi:transposase-like protein
VNATTFLHPRRASWRVLSSLHVLALISLLGLALVGRLPEDSAGWVISAPIIYVNPPTVRPSRRVRLAHATPGWSDLEQYVALTSARLFYQLGLLLALGGANHGSSLLVLPVLRWGLELAAVRCPGLILQPSYRALWCALWRLYQWSVLGLGWALVSSQLAHLAEYSGWGLGLGLGLLTSQATTQAEGSRSGAKASGRLLTGGIYEVRLSGDFVIRYQPVDEFDRRMFLLYLRQVRLVDGPPKQPFLRQEWLASWFGTYQELISRWESYHRAGDWRRLMSRQPGPPFSLDEQRPIVQFWATNFWLTPERVAGALAAQGLQVTASGVETVAKLSGFWWVRQVLLERFDSGPDGLQPKAGWLVGRLFKLMGELLVRIEAGEGLNIEERIEVVALQAQRGGPVGSESEVESTAQGEAERALPPLYWLEHRLFGWWQDVADGSVRCPHCLGTRVGRKSRQGRPKRFYDAEGQLWVIEVNRYYCQNRSCPYGSFTDLPVGLLPYSCWSRAWQRLALQEYAWARGTYRGVARQLGVSGATAYRWVEGFGQGVLPVAALFGLVRSSGVVGIDEKWVKVPKNDKPAGQHRKWMYVHFAVDVYTYDLLHIAILPDENSESAQAFLLELRAKGYRPSVIVTDLRKEYGPVIAAVFPKAEHHECVFHALQAWFDQLRDAYGSKYREKVPEAKALAEALEELFQAKTKRTARERYDKVLALRAQYVGKTPKVAGVFDSLERHFPKLLNAVESERIPLTNNAVELVIRRFEQHYRGFCGFDSIQTAQSYLAVFELVYRFSPFSPDAKPGVRGKCPLELAGYKIERLPITYACRGFPPHQPSQQTPTKEVVPSA